MQLEAFLLDGLHGERTKCSEEQDLANEDIERREKATELNIVSSPVINLQPNPAKDEVQIIVNNYDGVVELSVYNTMGKLVDKRQFNGEAYTLNCKNWSGGIYFIHAKIRDKQITHRLIITQ